MKGKENIDPTLRALGGRARYQLLQLVFINLGCFGAAYQLLDNIFIGRAVEGHKCAAPSNSTDHVQHLEDVDWDSATNITYSQCTISVFSANTSGDPHVYPCRFGYEYTYSRELSFRTEFDLVCDYKLLGGLVQTFVILGQGIGAVLSSIVSDRFGRKPTLMVSQFGLFVVGMAIGVAPSYPLLCFLKFLVGNFQQGVVGTMASMSIELFPTEYRSMQPLVWSVIWGAAACSMTLFAFLMRHMSWRYLQFALSAMSLLLCIIQMWSVDESLRWLMTNGKKDAAVRVMERASRINKKKLSTVLQTLKESETGEEHEEDHHEEKGEAERNGKWGEEGKQPSGHDEARSSVEESLTRKQAAHLTILDIFRYTFLLKNALIVWLAWFTCAFSFFTLYMMSTTLHGNRFVNYFLTALMEIPPGFMLYFLVDKKGRKKASQVFYILAGVGLMGGGIFRIFEDQAVLATMSVAMAMVGMVGASGLFGAVFFITPELFPTNLRNQSVGISSFAGRIGGMIAPFMTHLAEIAKWAPGSMIGGLCFLVVFLFRFLPETRGRELPHTVEDIKNWQRDEKEEKELGEKC